MLNLWRLKVILTHTGSTTKKAKLANFYSISLKSKVKKIGEILFRLTLYNDNTVLNITETALDTSIVLSQIVLIIHLFNNLYLDKLKTYSKLVVGN